MSEAGTAAPNPAAQAAAREAAPQDRVAELRVSGHLMTLDTGVFCVFAAPGSPLANDRSGLPGVRISLPPGARGQETVSVSTFSGDGWLNGKDDAALIRVVEGPAQVLVTVYQAPTAPPETAPRLQVMRIGQELAGASGPLAASGQPTVPIIAPEDADIVAHVQRTGDTTGRIGDWTGTRGSRQWIEGFSLTPRREIKPSDVEYQAVLGRGWLSPWIEGGKFCGSRGMALPLLGLKLRLKGNVAKTHVCSYSATFVDGSSVGPIPAGETCEAESLAALEAFQVVILPRSGEAAPRASRGRGKEPAAPAAERPAPEKPAARPGRRTR